MIDCDLVITDGSVATTEGVSAMDMAAHDGQIAALGRNLPLGRSSVEKFVELTATAPTKIDGLHLRKGAIAGGADADIAIRDPGCEVIVADGTLRTAPGSDQLQLRECAASMRPTGKLSPEFDPTANFGAQLL